MYCLKYSVVLVIIIAVWYTDLYMNLLIKHMCSDCRVIVLVCTLYTCASYSWHRQCQRPHYVCSCVCIIHRVDIVADCFPFLDIAHYPARLDRNPPICLHYSSEH